MIVLNWQPPMDSGGAEIQWYCLALAATETTIPNPSADTARKSICRDADRWRTPATWPSDDAPTTIVVASDTTKYTQSMLTTPDVISLYYRVYAVTDSDGDQVVEAMLVDRPSDRDGRVQHRQRTHRGAAGHHRHVGDGDTQPR